MTMPKGDEPKQAGRYIDRSESLRRFYAQFLGALTRLKDDPVISAFQAIAREPFAGPGPWQIFVPGSGYIATPDDDPAYLYQNTLVAIDSSAGINIGEPGLHVRCLAALRIRAGEIILHVGAGSGYYSAILATLTGKNGKVIAFEIEPQIARRCALNLAPYPWVDVRCSTGIATKLPEADVIYVNAGHSEPHTAWLSALRMSGRLIFPLQDEHGFGAMLLIENNGSAEQWPARFVVRAGFIQIVGAATPRTKTLSASFRAGGWNAVRSIRFAHPIDSTCWFAGQGWWLSTAKPS